MRYLLLALFAAACGSDSSTDDDRTPEGPFGPDGPYDLDAGCMLWSGGDYCPDAQHSNIFVCEVQPGGDCVESESPTPSPNHTIYCCSFVCHRSTPNMDGYCKDQAEGYMCYGESEEVAAELGCDPSSQSSLICC